MNSEQLIPIKTLCTHYKVRRSFFSGLMEHGLIEIVTVEESNCIHEEHLKDLETILHLHQDLNLNFEGIDTVLNLLDRINNLQSELQNAKNRLGIYENGT